MAIYIAVDPKLYHDGLMHLFPHNARPRAGEVLTEMATLLRRWLATQLVAMLVIGSATTIVLLLLGLLVAMPLVGAAMVLIKMLYVQDVVGDDVPLPGDATNSAAAH